uniref:CCHC-type domain-containing protein n=1 Tax=Tanacetum cinerariifolium TaxID=118510 RepID=A0A699HM36_TANCI|nr:hypothetical protein [Tanacetum cinerariifolium]
MTNLADKASLSGADNRPPMLEKDMYDSWKSRMELYMTNKQNGRMILEFVKNGPLLWPTIEENGVTRPKKYSKLSAMEAIQAGCDGRQNSLTAGTLRPYTSAPSGNNLGKQRTVVCYNCKGEGHMLKQCTKPKRKRDEAWFKDKIALMTNLSHYGFDNLAEVHNPDNVTNNVLNQVVQAMLIFKQSNIMNQSKTKITSDSNIIPYSQYVSESQYAAVQNSNFHAQQDALILIVIEDFKTQVINYTKINPDNKSINETLTAELERYKDQVRILKEGNNVNKVSNSCARSMKIDNLKQTLSEHLKEKES